MEQTKIKNLLIRVKDKDGKEGWISMTEFGSVFVKTIGETISEVGKEIENSLNTEKPPNE